MRGHWTRSEGRSPHLVILTRQLMLRVLLTLLAVPLALAAAADHRKLVDLAAAGNGVINLDSSTYDLVTAPDRNWSVAIQLTALDSKRRCAPCRYSLFVPFCIFPFPHFTQQAVRLHMESSRRSLDQGPKRATQLPFFRNFGL
jgi:hypothetical protein